VEAGVNQGWREFVGDAGGMVSLEHYGASADFARLYQEFGITAGAVAAAARASIAATNAPGGAAPPTGGAAEQDGGTGDR
jgi:transketolase